MRNQKVRHPATVPIYWLHFNVAGKTAYISRPRTAPAPGTIGPGAVVCLWSRGVWHAPAAEFLARPADLGVPVAYAEEAERNRGPSMASRARRIILQTDHEEVLCDS